MALRTRFMRTLLALSSFALLAAVGCFSSAGTLPSSVAIDLPDGTSVVAEQGAGAVSLANTEWQFFRTAGAAQGLAFVTVRFNSEGGLDSFQDSLIAQEIFGSAVYFDGKQHATTQQGLTYAASTYGAETSDATGFTFVGRMTAFAAGIQVGYATATATGTLNSDDPNIMTGTFSYSTRVTLPIDIPEANQDEEFPFIAHRAIAE